MKPTHNLTPEQVSEIVQAAVRTTTQDVIVGAATSMKCSCGGILHNARTRPEKIRQWIDIAAGDPPWHRKSRIRKKWAKKHAAETRKAAALALAFLPMVGRPGYICTSCNRRESFYRALGRNLFPVQPMPPGAFVTYDKALFTEEG